MSGEAQVGLALDDAWSQVAQGRPAVIRTASTEAVARWFAERPAVPVVAAWDGAALPDDGPPRAIWFHGGCGVRAVADRFCATVWLLDLAWLVVLSGGAVDAGPDLGRTIGPLVPSVDPADPAPAACRVTSALIDAEAEPSVLVQGLQAAVHHGRWVEACGWYHRLREVAPDQAAPHRWTVAARARELCRRDGLAQARAVVGQGGPGHAALLEWAALLMPLAQRVRLLEAAISRAESPSERADLEYRVDRTRMSFGAVEARDLRWPGKVAHTAEMLYFQVEKLPPDSAERAALVAEIEGLRCDLGTVLLQVAAHPVEDTDLATWVQLARAHLALGGLRQAAFDLSGKVMAEGPPQLRARVLRGVGRFPLRFADLPRLDAAVAKGDWAEVRRVARDVLGRHADGGFMHVVMDVVQRVADAVLDADVSGLVQVRSEGLREYLQPAFPELVEAAVPHAPSETRQRLRCQAATWWRQLAHPELERALHDLRAGAAHGRAIPVGDYDAVEVIGRGGMGEVWRGVHVGLGEPVAIKLLRSERQLELFLEEVELTAQLDHEAIVQVHDAGRVTAETAAASGERWAVGTPYLVMEYVPDGTLGNLTEPLDALQVRAVLLAVLDALAHAHARGVVHRDLKPDNVLVAKASDGLRIRLSDFGLAGIEAGRVSGTPSYMAPEQFGRGSVGPAADLYAVGCLATYLVTGAPPFVGTVRQLAMAHRFEVPRALGVPGLPEGFDAWRQKLLHKDPASRYATAWDAFVALEGLATPGRLAWTAPTVEVSETFVFGTLTGLSVDAEVVASAPLASSEPRRTVLPPTGFRARTARPRMPTTRLFARREPPRVGHHAVREALWQAAREALQGPAAVERVVRLADGVDLQPLVHDLVLRLRELGVDAGDDARDELVVRVGGPQEPAPSLRLESVRSGPHDLSVDLLTHVEIVAWLQAQVRLEPGLAWELARRAMGSTQLAGALLEEVLQRPLRSTPRGLTPSRPLEEVLEAERARWSERLRRLSSTARDQLLWAAVWVPGFDGGLHEAVAGPGATSVLGGRARSVRGRWTLAVGLRQLLREELRTRGELARRHAVAAERTTGGRQALHRLAAGQAGALEALLAVLRSRLGYERPPDGDLLDGVELALDLDLSPPGSEARAWWSLGHALRARALGRPDEALERLQTLATRDDEIGVRAERRSWALRPPDDVLAVADRHIARAVEVGGEPLAWDLRLERVRALGATGAVAEAEAELAALGWAAGPPGVRELGQLVGSELAAAVGDVQRAIDRLSSIPRGDAGAALQLFRSTLYERRGERSAARHDAVAVAERARGPVFVRAATRVARLALDDEDLATAERWAVAGLDFLVGTAWPEPRAQLEAVRLAALADRPGDEWELLWMAHGHSVGEAARIASSGAARAAAAGLHDRARRLAALDQPRKG